VTGHQPEGPVLVGGQDGCQLYTDRAVLGGALYFSSQDQAVMSPATWADVRTQPRLNAAFLQAIRERPRAPGEAGMTTVILDGGRFGRERRVELVRLRRLGADVGLVESAEQGLHHLLGQMAAPDRTPVQVGDLARRYGELADEVDQVRVALLRLEGMLELARAGVVEHLDPATVTS
jgi:hypothetical protein